MRIQRVQSNGVKRTTKVSVPMCTFAVRDIFAQPPRNSASEWAPAIVQYRAVAAGYHEGQHRSSGHYWALVRGTEPGHGNPLGYRRCNDGACTSSEYLDREAPGLKWDDPTAQRRVVL